VPTQVALGLLLKRSSATISIPGMSSIAHHMDALERRAAVAGQSQLDRSHGENL
jgi:aryl-alcohol dehydrogenase-like predicted oxidoreductase